MKRPLIVGVMGGGDADDNACANAYQLGRLIAERGWILLNGGRSVGIMSASSKGAFDHGGITVGILPQAAGDHANVYTMIPICTGMGSARNIINVLSSDIIVACHGGAGTVSEIALGLKHGKTVITLNHDTGDLFVSYIKTGKLIAADTPLKVIDIIVAHTVSQ